MNAKRRALALIAAAACIVATVLVVWQLRQPPSGAGPTDAAVPLHYFTASTEEHVDVHECRLTAVESSLWEIWNRPLQPCLADRGWTGSATWGAWSFGASSSVAFWLGATDWERITVRAKAYDGLPKDAEQTLRVELPGHTSEPAVVPRGWTDLSFDIPSGVLRPGANQVVLRFAHRLSPAEAGRGKDELPLAAAVERISLSRSTPRGASRRDAVRGQVFDRASGRFRIDRSGTLVLPIAIPPGAAEVAVEPGTADPASRRRGRAHSGFDRRPSERDAFEAGPVALGGAAGQLRRILPALAGRAACSPSRSTW
jgi:hypothetical protein